MAAGVALVAAGLLVVAGCGGTAAAVRDAGSDEPQRGFTSIPNLKKIAQSNGFSICSGFKGTQLPGYCQPGGQLRSTRGFEQVWKSKTAKSGVPSQLVVDVFTTPSAAIARRYVPVHTYTAGYIAISGAGVNNGIAGRIDSLANNGQTEFRFAWVSGRSMVEVNIVGPGLTLSTARDLARRARPA